MFICLLRKLCLGKRIKISVITLQSNHYSRTVLILSSYTVYGKTSAAWYLDWQHYYKDSSGSPREVSKRILYSILLVAALYLSFTLDFDSLNQRYWRYCKAKDWHGIRTSYRVLHWPSHTTLICSHRTCTRRVNAFDCAILHCLHASLYLTFY